MTSPRLLAGLTGTAVVLSLGLLPGSAAADDRPSPESRKRAALADSQDKAPSPALARTRSRSAKAPAGNSVSLLVGFKSGVDAAASASSLSAAGVQASGANQLAAVNTQRVTVAKADSARAAAKLRTDPAVAYVEADGIAVATDVTPNDPEYPQQTEMPQITVPTAWDTTTGSAVTVAVVDTGVTAVGDLTGAVLAGRDFINNDNDASDDDGHGTAVSSTIAGRGNNGTGIAGVCWQCKILPVKVLDATGSGPYSAISAGIIYAADRGAKIINLSLGGYSASTTLDNAVAYARGKGAVVFAAAGNDGIPNRLYPAASPGTVAVGGTDVDSDWYFECFFGICYGSNYGADWVDVAAPFCTTSQNLAGFSTAEPEDDYGSFCGTSLATPLVSGVAALLKSRHPNANNWSLENSLTSTAVPLPTAGVARFGEIRAARALAASVDGTAPKITGATPAHGKRFKGTVTVGATGVSDAGGSGLSRAVLYADGKYVGQDTTAPFSVKYNSGKRNSWVKLQWRVFDRAGNSAVFNRSLIADNAGPKVKITSAPKNGAKVKGTVTVKASASDAAGVNRVELLINGKVVAKDYAAGYSFKVKVSKYGKKIKVQVRSYDKLGNVAYTPARTWKR